MARDLPDQCPVGVLVIAAALRHLPPDEQRIPRRLDLAGAATLCAGLLLVVVPFALGRGEGWPAWTWLCLAAGAATLAAFPAVERGIASRGGAPLVTVAVLARPAVAWALITLTAATGTYHALLFTVGLLASAAAHRATRHALITEAPVLLRR